MKTNINIKNSLEQLTNEMRDAGRQRPPAGEAKYKAGKDAEAGIVSYADASGRNPADAAAMNPAGQALVALVIAIASVLVFGLAPVLAQPSTSVETRPTIYVPYSEIPNLVGATDKSVLLEKSTFEKLLKAARENKVTDTSIKLGQITRVNYAGVLKGDKVEITGELTIVSMSDKPVAVPLNFANVGLTNVTLDSGKAPLGFDKKANMVIVVTGKKSHTLRFSGVTPARDLRGGGVYFIPTLPVGAEGTFTVTAAGRPEIHATVGVAEKKYDEKSDATTATLVVGGHSTIGVSVLGNEHRDDKRAIILAAISQSVHVTEAYESTSCLATVHVLRRGVRELKFSIPADITVTDVESPGLVKWSVTPDKASLKPMPKILTVYLGSSLRGTQTLHIKGGRVRKGQKWKAGRIEIIGADFQRGYICVDVGGNLRVRNESLANVQRMDVSLAPEFLRFAGSRLYLHWGNDWGLTLDLATVELRRSSKEHQQFVVSDRMVQLVGNFDITAVGREMFDATFDLPTEAAGWNFDSVTVNGSQKNFEYRITDGKDKRTLRIELKSPVEPESRAEVQITMHRIPQDWKWDVESKPRDVSLPRMVSHVDTTDGLLSISAVGDLDAKIGDIPATDTPVPVGRMTSLGLGANVQYACSYDLSKGGTVGVNVSRRAPCVRCDAVGLASGQVGKLVGAWRLNFDISRATVRELKFLLPVALGQQVKITAPGRSIVTKEIAAWDKAPKGYNLCTLTLGGEVRGKVSVFVTFELPAANGKVQIPLVRLIPDTPGSEILAVQSSDEIAVDITSSHTKPLDTSELPQLPGAASRLIGAFRITPDPAAEVTLNVTVHQHYPIVSCIVTDAQLLTYIGADGSQYTAGEYHIANAGLQFLRIQLPIGGELWSVVVAGKPAKLNRAAGGGYQVGIPLSKDKKPFTVKIVCAIRGNVSFDNLKLRGVVLPGVKINRISWDVVPPIGFKITSTDGSMSSEGITPPQLQCEKTLAFLNATSGILLPSLSRAKCLAKQTMTASNLRGLGTSIAVYQGEYDGAWPTVQQLLNEELIEKGILEDVVTGKPYIVNLPRGKADVPDGTIIARTESRNGEYYVLTADLRVSHRSGSSFASMSTDDYYEAESPAIGKRLTFGRAQGRYSLPVDLVCPAGADNAVTFTALGDAEVTLKLVSEKRTATWWWIGFLFAILAGLGLLKLRLRTRVIYVIVLLTISTLLAIWISCVLPVANGAFAAGMLLIPFYLLVRLWRFIRSKFTHTTQLVQVASVLLVMFVVSGAAFGGEPSPPTGPTPIIVPYDGDPTKADESNKVLVPYRDYVELWNKANPKNTIELGDAPVEISFADVQYTATVKGDQLMLKLSADIDVTGNTKQFLTLGNLAIPEVKFAGKPVLLQATKGGTLLVLPARTRGKLEVAAVATAKISGQKGSVSFKLPPLPGAVMTLLLDDETLVLQAPKIGNVLTSKKIDAGRIWTIPLGAMRDITLNWAPKTGSGDVDKTLSAVAAHEVTVHQWAIMGVSKIAFTSSGGQNKSFVLLVPQELTVTEITCDNLRDHSETSTKTIDGNKYNVVEVRLQKPASKRHELTLRWAEKLPAQNKDFTLGLPQASGVARESGTAAIYSAGGIEMKIAKVTGGRQTDTLRSVRGQNIKSVARYYWAYRPFGMVCNITRSQPSLKGEINQLVRIDSRRVQLYVDATVTADGGKLFSASFSLPKQYELLSVVGALVDDWYEQPTKSGKLLHVNLREATAKAKIVLVLVHNKPNLDDFAVPVVKNIDADGAILKQTGLLALQLNKSLNAQTIKSENLRPIPPNQLKRWLTGKQLRDIQFAYKRTKGEFALNIKAEAVPTKIHAETMGALSVEPTMCMYTYRLRYHISGSPVDHVKFSLPNSVASGVAVTSPGMRNVTHTTGKKRTQWVIWLTDEITGTLDVAVNFTVGLDDKQQIINIPDIQTDSPQGLQTVVAVRNVSRAKLSVLDEASGYTRLGVEQQRKLLPPGVAKDLLCVYQSFGRDLGLRLKFEPAPKSSKIQAVVDLMNVTTVIDRDGNCRYRVKLSLQNRSEQFLRVKLPDKVSLWSAHVAGQAVKPVTKDRGSSEILIPLVKTSPGGLPYDVELYLAGRAVEKFSTVTTTIKPPAIEILGIDVMRTTWSLRLPGGYNYGDAKGNMSPILGTAEAMLIAGDTLLVQQIRLKKDLSSLSSSDQQRGFRNYEVFNRRIESNIKQTEEYIADNDDRISDDKLKELNKRVIEQRVALQTVNKQYEKGLKQQVSVTGLNYFVNSKSGSGGVSDAVTNDTMLSEPEFVKTAGQQLREQLMTEMKQGPKTHKAYQMVSINAPAKDVSQNLYDGEGLKSNQQRADESKEMLGTLQQEQLTNVARQQKKRAKQLKELDTNQMNRANFSVSGASASKSKIKRSRKVIKGQGRHREISKPQAAGMGPGSPPRMPPSRQVRNANGVTCIGTTRESTSHEDSKDQQAWGITAGGTYSLPVELPDGQVQLDFARPGGAAELSITATPDSLGASIWGSAITIAVAAISGIIALLIAKRTRKVQDIQMSLKTIIISLLLVCFAGLLMGLIGFILVVLLVWLMIIYRRPRVQKISE